MDGLRAGLPRFDGNEVQQIIYQWLDLIVERAKEEPTSEVYTKIADVVPDLKLASQKSNYLGRRLFGGEGHRTTPCPKHKGHWSGYAFPGRCACSLGSYDITGWLPLEGEETPTLGPCDEPGCGADATVAWYSGEAGAIKGCPEHHHELIKTRLDLGDTDD